METVRYTYRLRPGKQAQQALLSEWGRCRYLWNEAVHQFRTRNKPTFTKLSKLLTTARSKNAWLRDGSQVAQQQTLRNYALALNHSFKVKGRGRPQPKKRKTSLPTLEFTRNGFSIRDGRLILPKGISVPVVWSRELPSEPTSVRVYQDNLGHWYASFVVQREKQVAPPVEGSIGIDWGVTTTATTTNPAFDLPHHQYRKAAAAKLSKYQRQMARRYQRGKPQSKGYKQAKRQAARAAKSAQRQNTHAVRTWAKQVVDNHNVIAVEDFKPKFLSKTTMARKASDAAIGQAKRTLIEYANKAGRQLILVNPAFTTMTCSNCHARTKRLLLNERTFTCPTCNHTQNRDRNAARVILDVAERGHATIDDVRHPPPLGATVQSEVEIPRL